MSPIPLFFFINHTKSLTPSTILTEHSSSERPFLSQVYAPWIRNEWLKSKEDGWGDIEVIVSEADVEVVEAL